MVGGTWKVQVQGALWQATRRVGSLTQGDLTAISNAAADQVRTEQDKRLALESRLQIVDETHFKEFMFVGELSLDGSLQPIKGALPIAIRARAEHFKGLIVPKQNAREAAVVNKLEVYGMSTLAEVVSFISDKQGSQIMLAVRSAYP